MASLREKIVEKLDLLPEPSLHEVLDFVELLAWEQSNGEQQHGTPADDPFLSVIGTLPGVALSNEQIDLELYGPVTVEERADEAQ